VFAVIGSEVTPLYRVHTTYTASDLIVRTKQTLPSAEFRKEQRIVSTRRHASLTTFVTCVTIRPTLVTQHWWHIKR